MKATTIDLKELLSKTSFGSKATDLSDNEPLKKQGLDSLDLLDFYLSIEEKYDIHIPDEDTATLLTLEDYANYINKH